MLPNPLHRQRFRRKLLHRVAIYLLLPILTLLIARLIWGYEASHRLAATMAKLHAQGIPLTPEDFPDADAIPRNQNAFYDYSDLLKTFNLTNEESDLVNRPDSDGSIATLTRAPQEIESLEKLWAKNVSLGELLDDAATRPFAVMPYSNVRELLDYKRSAHDLAKTRLLGNFLFDMAIVAHTQGHDVESLHDLNRIFILSWLADEGPSELSHLISIAIRARGAEGTEKLESQVDLKNPAAELEASRLVKVIQNEIKYTQALPQSVQGEITAVAMNFPRAYPAYQTWWIRPLTDDEIERSESYIDSTLPAARAANWQQVKRLFPPWPYNQSLHFDHISLLDAATFRLQDDSFFYGTKEVILYHSRSISDGRAASLLLATRLYAAKYNALPQNATALVPEFLSQVPHDPFSLNNDPLNYRLDTAGPTVWSVGENGTDEGGQVLFDADGIKLKRYGDGSRSSNNSPDMVYGAAWRTATTPERTRKAPGNVSPAPPVN